MSAPLWTARPDAILALAECRRNPPALVRYRNRYGSQADEAEQYEGDAARRLSAIRDQHFTEITGCDWGANETDANRAHWLELNREQPTVEEVIETALAGMTTEYRERWGVIHIPHRSSVHRDNEQLTEVHGDPVPKRVAA